MSTQTILPQQLCTGTVETSHSAVPAGSSNFILQAVMGLSDEQNTALRYTVRVYLAYDAQGLVGEGQVAAVLQGGTDAYGNPIVGTVGISLPPDAQGRPPTFAWAQADFGQQQVSCGFTGTFS